VGVLLRATSTATRDSRQGMLTPPLHLILPSNLHLSGVRVALHSILYLPFGLNDYLRLYVPFKNFSLIWRRHHCLWRAAKFWPMLGAQGLWAGRDYYHATPAVTRYLGFSGLIRRTAPFSRLLRHTRGCGRSILTRILTGVLDCDYVLHNVNFSILYSKAST
jgi:hypothetical protein